DSPRGALIGDDMDVPTGGLELTAEGRHGVTAVALVAERAAFAQRGGAAGTIARLDGLANAREEGIALGVTHCGCSWRRHSSRISIRMRPSMLCPLPSPPSPQ